MMETDRGGVSAGDQWRGRVLETGGGGECCRLVDGITYSDVARWKEIAFPERTDTLIISQYLYIRESINVHTTKPTPHTRPTQSPPTHVPLNPPPTHTYFEYSFSILFGEVLLYSFLQITTTVTTKTGQQQQDNKAPHHVLVVLNGQHHDPLLGNLRVNFPPFSMRTIHL